MDDLNSDSNTQKRACIIITDNVTSFPENITDNDNKKDPFQDTAIIPGKPCDTVALTRAGAEDAHTIIIIPDFRHPDPDNYSLQIALTIKDFVDEKIYRKKEKRIKEYYQKTFKNMNDKEKEELFNKLSDKEKMEITHRPRVLVKVVDSNNATHFDSYTITGINEVVCEKELGLRALALSSINHHSASVFNEIMTYDSNGSELYSVFIPETWYKGKTENEKSITSFPQICKKTYEVNGNTGVIVVGYIRMENEKANVLINPPAIRLKENKIKHHEKGDRLLVLAPNMDIAATLFTKNKSDVD
jgi:hypothetical protein